MARILIVDDMPLEVAYIKDVLESEGHSVDILRTEEKFRKLTKEELSGYRVVILDIGVFRAQGGRFVGASAGIRLMKYVKLELKIEDRTTKFIVYTVQESPETKCSLSEVLVDKHSLSMYICSEGWVGFGFSL